MTFSTTNKRVFQRLTTQFTSSWDAVRKFLPYFPRSMRMVWDAAGWYIVAWSILTLISGVFPPIVISLTRDLVNMGSAALEAHTFDPIEIGKAAIPLVVLTVVRLFMGYATGWLNMLQSELASDHVSMLIQRKAISIDLARFEIPEYYNMLHLARTDAARRPLQLVQSGATFASSLIKLGGMLIILLSFSSWIVPLLFIASLPMGAVIMRYNRMMFRWMRGNAPEQRKATYYDDLLTDREAAAEVRMLQLGDYYHQKFIAIRQRIRAERLGLERKRILLNFGGLVVSTGVTGVTLAWMAWRVWSGLASIGDLVAFYQVLRQGAGSINGIQGKVNSTATNLLSIKYLFDFLDLKSEMKDEPTQPLVPMPLSKGIHFDNISFTYPESERQAITDFTWTIPAGKMVALVGENGTGKSTLVKLLTRLYDPDKGRVLWDGVDLKDMPLEDVRQQVLILFQHPYRYFDTAERIIGMGDKNEEVDHERIRWAAGLAHADEVVAELAQNYKTILGKRFGGDELSSGQWQRIALARSFYHDRPILVLDEPTSAIDSWTENSWIQHLREFASDHTVLLITHRLSTSRLADWIAVLHDGDIVEEGTHQDLLAMQGRYADAWAKQGYEDEVLQYAPRD